MPIYALGDLVPTIDPSAFVHPDAVLIGNVIIGAESSVWPTAVLRGDHGTIKVGSRTSVQDGTIVHCTSTLDTSAVNRGALEALIKSGALVGAQALIPNGMVVPSGAMALGVPAKIREDAVNKELLEHAAEIYVRNTHWYNAELRRLD